MRDKPVSSNRRVRITIDRTIRVEVQVRNTPGIEGVGGKIIAVIKGKYFTGTFYLLTPCQTPGV